MRALVSILLCTLLSMPWLGKLAITVDFFIHQDYIAANLCENREKPELHCDGKCVLMQKLNMAEEPDSQPKPLPEILAFDYSNFLHDEQALSEKWLNPDEYRKYISVNDSFPESVFLGGIFEPPRIIA